MSGCGLRAPARADVTPTSTNASRPAWSRNASSSQPQFEQTPMASPASRNEDKVCAASGYGTMAP